MSSPDKISYMIDTGDEIRKRRKALKWRQHQLAEKLGVTQTAVVGWEGNKYFPNAKNIVGLSLLFKCTPHELVGSNVSSDDLLEMESILIAEAYKSSPESLQAAARGLFGIDVSGDDG